MGLKSFFSKAGYWLWNLVKTTAKNSEQEILEQIRAIAFVVVEDVSNTDLNGDGKVAAALEVVDLAKASSLKWAKKLLADGENSAYKYLEGLRDSDFKRYLALARIATQTAKRFGLDKTPTTHVILGIIQAVLGSED